MPRSGPRASAPGPPSPNLLDRQFTVTAPSQIWLADITSIRTGEGWLFLAVILDLFSRKVVGWPMADSMPQELTLAALRMAVARQRPGPRLNHHEPASTQAEEVHLLEIRPRQRGPSH